MKDISYGDYVKALALNQQPRLKLLADFMSNGVGIAGYHSDEDVQRRLTKVNVTVVDNYGFKSTRSNFTNCTGLIEHLDAGNSAHTFRLIIAEGLSRDTIELLGSRYDLDPRFFENHLRGLNDFLAGKWSGDCTSRLESSTSDVLERPFHDIPFLRPFEFNGWPSAYSARRLLNVPRVGCVARNLYVKEIVSIYNPIPCAGGLTMIVACDPLLDTNLPTGIHLRSHEKIQAYSAQQTSLVGSDHSHKHESMTDRLCRVLDSQATTRSHDLVTAILGSILRQACDFCAVALHDLKRISYLTNSLYAELPRHTYSSMLKLHNQSGGRAGVLRMVRQTLQHVKLNYKHRLPPTDPTRQYLELDVNDQESRISEIIDRSEHLLRFLAEHERLRDAREAFLLSKIALLFVPFSTIATMVSIQNIERLIIFLTLVLPVVGVVALYSKFRMGSTSMGFGWRVALSRLVPLRLHGKFHSFTYNINANSTAEKSDTEAQDAQIRRHQDDQARIYGIEPSGSAFDGIPSIKVENAVRLMQYLADSIGSKGGEGSQRDKVE